MDNPIKTAKDAVGVVGDIIKIAGDNPDVRQAGDNLVKTALTITKTINNALLPLAAINFAFDKARVYFASRFQQDLAEKAAAIPPEQIVEPKASVAGPALQGLAFTHEERNLKEMYLSLLATAMDGRVCAEAHPAFVEIIRQMSSEEASLVRGILQTATPIPIVEARFVTANGQGWYTLTTHMLDLKNLTGTRVENPRVPAMVDNWIRLGLVRVDYTMHLTDTDNYSWVDQRPEVVYYRQLPESERHLTFANGIINRTALGQQFAKAVGLLS